MENVCYAEVRDQKFEQNLQPTVSVAIIAYNVEKYLVAAVESVLNQKTNFKVELVIGEDSSTDNTRKIALDYRDKYPNIIKVLLPEKNQGLTPNSIATQNACNGTHIALLDGDDYWTNVNKLQVQIDFLENNPEFSGVAHQAEVFFDDVEGMNHPFGDNNDAIYYIKDTIQHRKFHTSSLVYRKVIWDNVGGIPSSISSNERAIYPLVAIFGKIKYFKESMCIYRKSSIGLSSRISAEELETDLAMIPWLKNIDKNFPYFQFKAFLHLCIYTYPAKIRFSMLMKHAFMFIFYSFSYFPKNFGDVKYGIGEFIKIFKRDII